MNAKLITLATLLAGSSLSWGQDIVLKATFVAGSGALGGVCIRPFTEIDVNDDGVPEIPIYKGYLDRLTYTRYMISSDLHTYVFEYPQSSLAGVFVAKMRRNGLAEWITTEPNFCAIDIETGDILLSGVNFAQGFSIFDYDNDGFDDIIAVDNTYTCNVYGIATGNPPISPPQVLDIQQVGQDYVISWAPVADATAYRIEWSSALDGGVRFTRIGYTTGTTFTHRNQVGQERGFYRVLSEDNGTGVVRMVGSTTLGK